MSWKIEYLEPHKTISITTLGPQDMSMVMRMTTEVAALAAQYGVTRFLKDDRQTTLQLTTMELFEVPELFSQLGIPRHCRIALVVKSRTPRLEDFHFFKVRMYNAGNPEVEIFVDSIEQAMQWLTTGSPNQGK